MKKPDAEHADASKRGKRNPSTAELAGWNLKRRKHDPLELLRHASAGRLPALAKLKMERMSATPFGFFRGAAPVMAYDLSLGETSGIVTQLCGDAHVQNLGAFCGLDNQLVFDINDFDETIRGPFEWDVKRMATSILLAGHDAKIKPHAAEAATHGFLNAYSGLMHRFAGMAVLEVARFEVRRLETIAPISNILRDAERATPQISLDKLTEAAGKSRRFKSHPPLLRRVTGKEAAAVLASLTAFRRTLLPERQHFLAQFKPIDVAFKVVGTGSVGLRDYCVYLEGNGPGDPLFLQIKEEAHSAYADYLPAGARLRDNQGQRAVEGQRAMQLQSDPLLGWTSLDGRDYLVRQLNDHKATLDITCLKGNDLLQYAEVCGEILARGHARSGEARDIAAFLGKGKRFSQAMLDFAEDYARQTADDWKKMLKAQKPAS